MSHVIVIGTGIVGASCAYELIKKGHHVTMIDAEKDGRATSAGAGIIAPWANQRRNKDWYLLARSGAKLYQDLIKELEDDGETETGYKRIGSLQLYEDEKKSHKMEQIVLKKREEAPEIGQVTILSEQETKEAFPYVNDGFHALYIEGAARVDGRQLREALIRASLKRGAQYIQGEASLLDEKTVQVKGEKRQADRIVLANGVWMNDSLKIFNMHTSLYMQKGQLIHLHCPELIKKDLPMVNIPSDPYIVPFDHGRIVVGATREDKVTMDTRHHIGAIYELLQKTFTFAQGLDISELREVRTGFRPFTPSFIPTFGRLAQAPSIYYANGLGSSGLTTGPFIGSVLAKLISDEETIDPSPYNIEQYQI